MHRRRHEHRSATPANPRRCAARTNGCFNRRTHFRPLERVARIVTDVPWVALLKSHGPSSGDAFVRQALRAAAPAAYSGASDRLLLATRLVLVAVVQVLAVLV